MNIDLNTISLTNYDGKKHKKLLEEFTKASSSRFIHDIEKRLTASSSLSKFSFPGAYVTEENDNPFGYVYLSNIKDDEVYIEISILKDKRSGGYGSRVLKEVSDYVFENYNIKSIRCDIDPSNQKSIDMVEGCGFYIDEEEFASRNYIGKIEFVKDNMNYISKRRK